MLLLGNLIYSGQLHIEANILNINGTIKALNKEIAEVVLVGKEFLNIEKGTKMETRKVFLYGKKLSIDENVQISSNAYSCITTAH